MMVNGNREGDATAKQERTGQSKRALVQKPLYREGDTTAPSRALLLLRGRHGGVFISPDHPCA